ncbi:protease inhibitor I42 family protein [Poriferisphaera sp. WC338]|uniref:protease inhibitor I42 family protein n=1 Tax=Poriferisphaera sp. WC338 TaxID=3425129 RepID=UPI003D819BD4
MYHATWSRVLKTTTIFTCITIVLFTQACQGPYYPTANPTKVEDGRNGSYRVTEKDNGALVYINIGQRLYVSLKANPTTGYLWTLGQDQPAVLNPLGEPVYTPTKETKPNGELVGSGGTSTWTFLAQKTGITNVRFIYHRPWEADEKPAKTYRITVHVIKDKTTSYPLQRDNAEMKKEAIPNH